MTPKKRKTAAAIAPAPKKNRAAQALGRLGGLKNTDKQRRARTENSKRAGRPGRLCPHCNEPVYGGHKDRRLDALCPGQTWVWAEPRNRREDTP